MKTVKVVKDCSIGAREYCGGVEYEVDDDTAARLLKDANAVTPGHDLGAPTSVPRENQ